MDDIFIVLELQTENGTTSVLPAIVKTEINEAYQAYYQILAAAAVSNVDVHAALILTDKGSVVRSEHFIHKQEEAE